MVNGRISSDEVNVDRALENGETTMKTFELYWPIGFNAAISKEVKTMQLMKKHVGVGAMKVYATNGIYSRIIGLQASVREELKYELAPVPMGMFENSGDMTVAKPKSTLKREVQVESSNRHTDHDNSLVVDGSAMLWESLGLCRQGSDLDPQECSRIWCLLCIRQIHGV